MKSWIVAIALLIFGCSVAVAAQEPLSPVGAPEPAAPAAGRAPQTDAAPADRSIESYIGARLAVPTAAGVTRFKVLSTAATPGVSVVELENGWLRYHVHVGTASVPTRQPRAYQAGQPEIEELLAAFAALSVVPRERIDTTLAQLGLVFENVYAPATPPFFNNGRGVVWLPKFRRFVLSVRGIVDATANRCFKAVVDLETGDLTSRVNMPCSIR